jgi:hypothetical protein
MHRGIKASEQQEQCAEVYLLRTSRTVLCGYSSVYVETCCEIRLLVQNTICKRRRAAVACAVCCFASLGFVITCQVSNGQPRESCMRLDMQRKAYYHIIDRPHMHRQQNRCSLRRGSPLFELLQSCQVIMLQLKKDFETIRSSQ